MHTLDRHITWFTAEFLGHPGPFWSVDWPATSYAVEHGDEVDVTGTVVRFDGYPTGEDTERRVWVLTGEYSRELNSYQGKWPD